LLVDELLLFLGLVLESCQFFESIFHCRVVVELADELGVRTTH
jgi:hypothetical protein